MKITWTEKRVEMDAKQKHTLSGHVDEKNKLYGFD